jgi:hypothetical protein
MVAGVAFCAGLSLFLMYRAKLSGEVLLVGVLLALGVIFALLAEILLARRLTYPRALELLDHAILLPRGLFWTKIETIRYTDVLRIVDCGDGVALFTGMGQFEIVASRFDTVEHYLAVREFVAAKTSIALPACTGQSSSRWQGFPPRRVVHRMELPPPLVHWTEPEDWARYRAHVAKSKPMLTLVRNELWFFARCLVFILVPWLLLQLSQIPTSSAGSFLGLALVVAAFFTALHWLGAIWPVHAAEISVRDAGMTRSACSGQQWDWNYRDLFGWAVIEREFREHILHVLLIRHCGGVAAIALPDASVREQLEQVLLAKQVLQVSDIKPPWETEP